jgi:hypothetical protein
MEIENNTTILGAQRGGLVLLILLCCLETANSVIFASRTFQIRQTNTL